MTTDTYILYYSAIVMITALAMLILCISIANTETVTKTHRKRFITLFLVIATEAIIEWLGVLLDGNAKLRILHIASKSIELGLAPLVPICFVAAVATKKESSFMRIPFILNLSAILLSQPLRLVFYIDSNGFFHRERFYGIFFITFLLEMAQVCFVTIRNSHRWQNRNAVTMILLLLFICSAMIIQVIDAQIRIDWICAAMVSMLFFFYFQSLIEQSDPLTALLSRRCFETRKDRIDQNTILFSVDVNNFKAINDGFGHAAGDQCLRKVADVLRKTFSHHGLCYRTGGDEFVVIMTKELDKACHLAKKAREGCAAISSSVPGFSGIAIGYAVYTPDQETFAEALAEADTCMYRDKEKTKPQD